MINKESEPTPKGFRMRVENPELFLNSIKSGASGEVGLTFMSFPIEKVDVDMYGGKDSFNFEVNIRPTSGEELGNGVLRNFLIFDGYKKSIIDNYPDTSERGGVLIVKGKRGTTLAINRETGLDKLVVTTGRHKISFVSDEVKQFGQAPASTPEGLSSAIEDLNEAVELLLAGAYREGKSVIPDEELILRPPKVKLNGHMEKNGESITPDNLLGKIEIEKPAVKFEDIGGQQEAKREVQGLAFALKNPELYKKWGTTPPKGIILYGPPGTGKTLMAEALASQADARFFHVQVSDIVSKWYGESEQIVKSIFELAGQNGEKTIIFFDEIDALAQRREGAHEATQRVMSTLLENMDGMASKNNIMVLASTNRLDSIDPALLRAGRFDRWVEVPLPDDEGKKQIFNIHMLKAEKNAGRALFNQVSLDAIIPNTENTSGADIAEIVRRVLEEKVRQEGMGQEPSLVSTEDVLRELKNYERTRKTKRSFSLVPPDQK